MPGVEILNTEVVYVTRFSTTPIVVCVLVGLVVGLLIAYFDAIYASEWILYGLAGALVGLLLGALMATATALPTDEVDYVKYDVVISDEVNFNEFTEHYEIIEQKGKIYTVKEKTK